jgi:hypothetical protein
MIKNRLKLELKRNGMDPALLDNPELVMEDQAGKTDQEILNEDHEPGLKSAPLLSFLTFSHNLCLPLR